MDIKLGWVVQNYKNNVIPKGAVKLYPNFSISTNSGLNNRAQTVDMWDGFVGKLTRFEKVLNRL